jgi:UDP-glucose 4-epimerase
MKFKKILVTGATGFIGSFLIPKLVDRGYDIAIISRLRSNRLRLRKLLSKVKIYKADLLNTRNTHQAVLEFQPEVIIHLAAYYSAQHRLQEIRRIIDANVLGTVNLIEAAKDAGVKLFVNTSSCFVYKRCENKLKETSPLEPFNFYALTKILAEQSCSFYAQKYGLNCVTLRLFPPYGSCDHKRKLIPYLIESFIKGKSPRLTSGKQKWDFIYAQDIADAYLRVLAHFPFPKRHEIFNVGTGTAVSIRELVLNLKKIMHTDLEPAWGKIPEREDEFYFLRADISKAGRMLIWRPKINILKRGLELTAISYRDRFVKKEGGK